MRFPKFAVLFVTAALALSFTALCDDIVERPSIMGLTVSEVKGVSGLELRIKGTDGNSAFIITGVKSKQAGKEINILATQGMAGFYGAKPGQSGTFDYTLKIPAGVDEVTFGEKKAVIWKRGTPAAKATASPAATPLSGPAGKE